MSFEQLSNDDKVRISSWVDAGIKVMQEINDLKEGLKDTTKALAEEFDVKPAILNKALRAAMKANMEEERNGLTQVEEILQAAGRL